MTGTTSCVLLITKDKIYCANSGDSRAVLCSNNEAIALSEDHKPGNPEELRRNEKSGHSVDDDRVDGNLALSRAIHKLFGILAVCIEQLTDLIGPGGDSSEID